MLSPTLIHHFLENSAAAFPDKLALIHGEMRATYSQINKMADHLASWLIGNNVRKGDRVVIILENSLEYVVSYYGNLKAGCIVVPLTTDIKSDALNLLLKELEPKVIISNSRHEKLLQSLDQTLSSIETLIIVDPKENRSSSPIRKVDWENVVSENGLVNPAFPLNEAPSAPCAIPPASRLHGSLGSQGARRKAQGVLGREKDDPMPYAHALCRLRILIQIWRRSFTPRDLPAGLRGSCFLIKILFPTPWLSANPSKLPPRIYRWWSCPSFM